MPSVVPCRKPTTVSARLGRLSKGSTILLRTLLPLLLLLRQAHAVTEVEFTPASSAKQALLTEANKESGASSQSPVATSASINNSISNSNSNSNVTEARNGSTEDEIQKAVPGVWQQVTEATSTVLQQIVDQSERLSGDGWGAAPHRGGNLEGLSAADIRLSSAQREKVSLFLQQHFSFPGARTCGWWTQSYKELHRQIRAKELPAKYITYQPPKFQGLGDRLLGLVSTFLAGLITERALIVDDPLLRSAFDPAELDWEIKDDVNLNVTTMSLKDVGQGSVLFLRLKNRSPWLGHRSVRFPVDLVEFVRRFKLAENVIVETNGGVLASIFGKKKGRSYATLSALGLKLQTAYSCILRFLLKPRPEVGALMYNKFDAMHSSSNGNPQKSRNICIHMRVPDSYTWDPHGRPISRRQVKGWILNAQKNLFYCAERVMRRRHLPSATTKWLFMSESSALRQLAKQTYPQFVLLSDVKPMHPGFNQTQLQRVAAMRGAVADWLLFSTCQFYVIVNSGFCKTALAYSVTAKGAFFFRRPSGWDFQGHCDPWRPDNLTALGESYSGL